jgi:amino acid transporter
MTLAQLKATSLSIILGAVVATSSYMLITASYVGASSDLTLSPTATDAGTLWHAENKEVKIEVRYISSLLETPSITITKKQQWLPLAICMITGILIAFFTYRIARKKSTPTPDAPTEQPTPDPLPSQDPQNT